MSLISHGVPIPVEALIRVGGQAQLFLSFWWQRPPSWSRFPPPALGAPLCNGGGPLASGRGSDFG